jgi:hypothetical protein
MFLGYARGAGNLKPDRQPWLSSLLNRRRSHTGEPHNVIDGGSADSSSDRRHPQGSILCCRPVPSER